MLQRNSCKTRAFHLLLLAAFVYQLNACPCGCLEHNGWFQLGHSLLASASTAAEHDYDADAEPQLAAEDSHCDGHGLKTYLAENSSRILVARTLRTIASVSFVASCETEFHATCPGYLIDDAVVGKVNPQGMRALFQVFLI